MYTHLHFTLEYNGDRVVYANMTSPKDFHVRLERGKPLQYVLRRKFDKSNLI